MAPAAHMDKAIPNARLWGSDPIAGLLRTLDIEFIALTPGASLRGLHDSLVNYLGNTRPELLLCLHEEHSVAIAHGYAKVRGRPMAVALHSNVGLMHATMAIFNAWCDRVPILMLGAVGPMDAVQRRPWIDWIHTARDLGALVRGYTKWDDQPSSVPAALESVLRAHQIAMTAPNGPVFVCLDAGLQEQEIDATQAPPGVARFQAPQPADPPAEAVSEAAKMLAEAKSPLILIGRVSSAPEDWHRRVQLAERLDAPVVTDIKTGASFPTMHPLHPFPPGLYISNEAGTLIKDADVILSLDWIDLGGTLRQACGGTWPVAAVIQCSLDQYVHNGWSMDYQALPPAEITMLASPDRLVRKLLEAIPSSSSPKRKPPTRAPAAVDTGPAMREGRISIEVMAEATTSALAGHSPSYIRLPIGWPGEHCRFSHPLDYIGYDGGGGIGSGPGMAVGAALALRGTGRLPVAIIGDGDYLMGLTAIWTGVHHKVPVLIIVSNNQSFFNDELHQERVARMRQRPVENRWIGLRMSDPPLNLAVLAEGQGAVGLGPVTTPSQLKSTLAAAIDKVRQGATCVVDVHVAPEYARATSTALLRQIPS
ncbi:MAG: thiamine pyrophosphate-binding protein [Proteobacteria bacterium]|nr:thiamine pyrophosphate-binding protein [Pseudomonadota bacterium]